MTHTFFFNELYAIMGWTYNWLNLTDEAGFINVFYQHFNIKLLKLKLIIKQKDFFLRRVLMKVLHLIGGGDVGGAKSHVLSLVRELGKHINVKLISFRTGAFADDARAMV